MGDFWNDTVMEAARNDTLMELLRMLPRWRWGERSSEEWTFLHYACYGNNEAALVALAHELDVDARDHAGSSPAHLAALLARPRVLEVLSRRSGRWTTKATHRLTLRFARPLNAASSARPCWSPMVCG